MSKTLSAPLLAHFQSECQTRTTIWVLKLNYRRINIASAAGTTITTVEDHNISVGQYVSISNATGTAVDDPHGTWRFHEVVGVTATTITTADPIGTYAGSGTLHESYGFTSHVEDIERDGLLYRAETAFTPTAAKTTDKLQIPTQEMEGVMLPLLSIDGISEDDIISGRVDFAEVRTQLINYEDLSMGGMWIGRGYVGKTTVKNDQYIAELRGLTQIASQQILELYSPGCRYDLGSRRCTVDLTDPSYLFTSTISGITTDRLLFTSGLGNPADFFKFGKVTWQTGENAGLEMEVKNFPGGGVVELWQPMPFAFTIGDSFQITAGCDKKLETCRDKFDNLINFGGFAHLPGEDNLAQVLVPKRPEVTVTS